MKNLLCILSTIVGAALSLCMASQLNAQSNAYSYIILTGPIGSVGANAMAINNKGQVVGMAINSSGIWGGFIYDLATDRYTNLVNSGSSTGLGVTISLSP